MSATAKRFFRLAKARAAKRRLATDPSTFARIYADSLVECPNCEGLIDMYGPKCSRCSNKNEVLAGSLEAYELEGLGYVVNG